MRNYAQLNVTMTVIKMGTNKYSFNKRVDNSAIPKKQNPNSIRQMVILFLLGLFLVVGLVFYTWISWKQTELIYFINETKAEKSRLLEERRKKLSKANQLLSLSRVRKIASEKLGLVLADYKDIIFVEYDDRDVTESMGYNDEQ